MGRRLLAGIVLMCSAVPAAAVAEPVLLISIDGLRPADVTEAEQRGLAVPNLRRFVREGTYATGVVGILPTLTYPSHSTLITGVAPARHGIVSNTTFDPKQINYGGWFWYSSDLTARTLWDAARDAGLSTGNVHWPVSVGARSVTWNLPQIWRSGHEDDRKLVKTLATAGLVDELEHDCGPYADGIDESVAGDENRAKFGVDLIKRYAPGFLTVYLTGLDHEQHASGPGSAPSHATLERIDALIGQLVAAEAKAHPDAVVALVSDHGFAATDTEINFYRPFIDAGLIKLDGDGKIASWEATPWPSGGSVAIVLARPDDKALLDKVQALVASLAANPDARIARVIDRTGIATMGGNPQASFYVDLKPGAMAGVFAGGAVPLAKPSRAKGMHGYFPGLADMRSTFMVMGKGVPAAHSLGEIDMRAIAPTLARVMGATLPGAGVAAIDLGAGIGVSGKP
jgi:predicted AlkP superfamily pyrophosphatase or phosphodiesterase